MHELCSTVSAAKVTTCCTDCYQACSSRTGVKRVRPGEAAAGRPTYLMRGGGMLPSWLFTSSRIAVSIRGLMYRHAPMFFGSSWHHTTWALEYCITTCTPAPPHSLHGWQAASAVELTIACHRSKLSPSFGPACRAFSDRQAAYYGLQSRRRCVVLRA